MSDEILGSLSDCFVYLPNGKRAMVVGDGNIPLDISITDQATPVVDKFLTQKLADVTLASPVSLDDRTVTLEAGHGFTAPGMIEIEEGIHTYQSRVIAVDTNTLTVTNPFCCDFTTAAIARRVSPDMNINASAVAPVVFSQKPPEGIRLDINILAINIRDGSAMDDTTFGGIPALTNGVVFRTLDGNAQNIFTAIDNGCIIRHCDTGDPFTDRAPAGEYALNSKRRFNGQQGDGVARRIVGENVHKKEFIGGELIDVTIPPSEFQAIIADNLTGLTRFWCVIRGHQVEGI